MNAWRTVRVLPPRTAAVACLLFASLSPLAAAPRLVEDLRPGLVHDRASIDLFEAVAAGGVLYFGASDPDHGYELWRSDGTAHGTYRLTDVCAGPCGSSAFQLTPLGRQLFFTADDGVSGSELWVTDGTPGGERRVVDLCPGPCGSQLGLTAANGRIFLTVTTATGVELWLSDGTRRGTARVMTLCSSSGCTAGTGPVFDHRVIVSVFSTGPVLDLSVSDGTAAGTRPFASLVGARVPRPIATPIPAGRLLFFWTADGLWRTDLTPAGTSRVARQPTATDDEPPLSLASGGALYALLPNGDVLRSDGTAAGTRVVSQAADHGHATFLLGALPVAGGILLETLDDLLWIGPSPRMPRSLGRAGGIGGPGGGFVSALQPLGDRAAYLVDRQGSGEVWITDGTIAGTRRAWASPSVDDSEILATTDRLVFFLPAAGDLWTTDGTPRGTRRVRDLGTGPASSGPLAQTAAGGKLLFSAQTGVTSAPLFTSDGTAGGTGRLSAAGGWASSFAAAGGETFFASLHTRTVSGYTFLVPNGLWKTDGSPAGTRAVAPELVDFGSPAALGRLLLFSAAREVSPFNQPDLELFRSDGTSGGTALVKDIDPYQADTTFHHICVGESSSPEPGAVLRGRLLFAAGDSDHGRELWTTDGTKAGTRLLADINPGLAGQIPPTACSDGDSRTDYGLSSDPAGFVRFQDGALFTADDGSTGRELWWTDGTTAGTRRVADLRPGPDGSSPHDLVAFGGDVYFIAAAGGEGETLWKSDGTEAGTVEVSDLRPAGSTTPSWAGDLTVSGDRLFLAVYNETTGAELWASEGDAASTAMVADLRPGPGSSSPQQLADAGGRLVFAADDGTTGVEPWVSDGTAAGTRRLGDIHPGRDASSPGPFTLVGGNLLFGADDGVHGRELWAIPVSDLTP
ncbi:MAG TPA: ELWxxDGT repeat protein [Thermoanaerobaculia bacterium]